MKHLSIALIAVGVMAACLGADIWLDAKMAHDWGNTGTLVLIWCAIAWWQADD